MNSRESVVITCRMVSLMSIPPADMLFTKSFCSCLFSEKRYAARGFDFELITSKLSSKFSTCYKGKEIKD